MRTAHAALLAAVLAWPATAAQRQQEESAAVPAPGGPPAATAPAAPPPAVVRLVPARRLVGRRLLDAAGEPLGEVRMLTVDLAEHRVRHLLVREPAEKTDKLRPVPWEVLRPIPAQGALRSEVVRDALAKPPLYEPGQLAALTGPAANAAIRDFYGLPKGAAAGTPARPLMLLDGDGLATLEAPGQAPERPPARDAAGDRVLAPDGAALGHVDEVMIEPATGAVPFVLMARGGFLGLGQEWVPVPLSALAWDAEAGGYRLQGAPRKLAGHPREAEPPRRVRREDLEELRRRFEPAAPQR